MNDHESIRIKYKYRKLIQKGNIRLSHQGAVKLIGPDCAYHLYTTMGKTDESK